MRLPRPPALPVTAAQPRASALPVLAAATLLLAGCTSERPTNPEENPFGNELPLGAPQVDRTVWLAGLSNPWDLAFLPNGDALLTERGGRVRLRRADGALATVAQIPDVVAVGEGGLLGLAIDPEFATNRFVYACFSSNLPGTPDNRVARWRLAADGLSLADRVDIVTGMPRASNGRHSGCRPRFGNDGYLWIGTGDAANGENPQRGTSLGGKVLRVTRDGSAAPGNPAIDGVDPRVFTLGHRNVQGLAFRAGTATPMAVEHGPSQDDEVTPLVAGGNGGWNPVPGYNEAVPMTDVARYPTAMRPVWQSGRPARGTSGATFIAGASWRGWNGALVLAQLVGAKLVVLTFDAAGSVSSETTLFADRATRLRVAVQGPDEALYVLTDVGNGGGEVWRITPR